MNDISLKDKLSLNEHGYAKNLAKMYEFSSNYLIQSDTELNLFVDEDGELSHHSRFNESKISKNYDLEEDLMSACVKTALIKLISKELINMMLSDINMKMKFQDLSKNMILES